MKRFRERQAARREAARQTAIEWDIRMAELQSATELDSELQRLLGGR